MRALTPAGEQVFQRTDTAPPGLAVLPPRGVGFVVRPVFVRDEVRHHIERFDLRTGATTATIDAGRPGSERVMELGDTRPAVASNDGRTVALLRTFAEDVATPDGVIRVDLYHAASGAALSSRRSSFALDVSGPRTRERGLRARAEISIHAIPPDRYLLVQRDTLDARQVVWTFLDESLTPAAVLRGDDPAHAWLGDCAPDLMTLPNGSGWLADCGGGSGVSWKLVRFSRDLSTRKIDLPSPLAIGRPVAWHVSSQGIVSVLTGKPAIVRVDPRRDVVIEERSVVDARSSMRWPFGPLVAAAKLATRPEAQFSPDGHRAYVVPQWLGRIAFIDVPSATMRTVDLNGDMVSSLHLSADGTRLYAVTFARWGEGSRLHTLDAISGAVLSSSDLPGSRNELWSILAVVPSRTPASPP